MAAAQRKVVQKTTVIRELLAGFAIAGMWMRKQAMARRSRQSRRVLPKDLKNLELLLLDTDAKGFLDIELVWKLRQKEGLKNVRGKIARKIQRNDSALCFEESVLSVLAEVL